MTTLRSSGRSRSKIGYAARRSGPSAMSVSDRADHGARVVAGAGRHADRRRDPERRGGRQAADGDALADDRAGAEEADARDDLRRDARRVGAHDGAAARQELVEAVRGDDREQRRAETDEQVRPEPGLALAQLALEADRRRRARRRARAAGRPRPSRGSEPLRRRSNDRRLEGGALRFGDLLDPLGREVDQRVEARRARTARARPSPAPRRGARRRS